MDQELEPWIALLDRLAESANNLTIGLIAGSREPTQRSVLERLAQCGLPAEGSKGLLIRLNMGSEALPKRHLKTAKASEQAPLPALSPLGRWHDVCIPMRPGMTAPPALERLPRWLNQWKSQFGRILLDLGPLDQPFCRSLARYCDCNMLLLGPETCGSPSWLRRHIDHLTQCDGALTGSLVISTAEQAVA